jgi:predicted extracellular nuclease
MTRAIGMAVGLCIGAACAPNLDADYGGSEEPSRTACGPGLAPHDVRGVAALNAAASGPPSGQLLDVVGVATLALSLGPELEGFFLQSLEDADPIGAEALFVAWPGAAPAPGTRVHARGTLGETAGSVQLQAIERLDECGSVEVSPQPLDARELAQPESRDGSWVRASGDWRVIDVPASPADGRLTASPRGRVFASGHALANTEAAELWTLRPVAPALARAGDGGRALPRLGAALGELEGVLSVRGQTRQLFTAEAPAWPSEAPAPPARPSGGGLRIVGLNLDNYFVSLGARGARSAADLARQRDALVALFVALDADILALTELENRAADSLIHLLEGLDRALPSARRYAFEEAPAPSGSVLRAGIAFRPGRVRARGAAWFSATPGFRRAPLFQAFTSEALSFTLGVVHLASKRCDDEPVVVPPEGCGGETRRREAELLLDTAHAVAASAPLEPLLLMGDFNADAREAPLELLARGGYHDLLSALPATDRYSYVFEGRASLLDHALAPDGFEARVRSAAIWHINADEPRRMSAMIDAAATPRGSSDHDPIVIDLQPASVRPMGL